MGSGFFLCPPALTSRSSNTDFCKELYVFFKAGLPCFGVGVLEIDCQRSGKRFGVDGCVLFFLFGEFERGVFATKRKAGQRGVNNRLQRGRTPVLRACRRCSSARPTHTSRHLPHQLPTGCLLGAQPAALPSGERIVKFK